MNDIVYEIYYWEKLTTLYSGNQSTKMAFTANLWAE